MVNKRPRPVFGRSARRRSLNQSFGGRSRPNVRSLAPMTYAKVRILSLRWASGRLPTPVSITAEGAPQEELQWDMPWQQEPAQGRGAVSGWNSRISSALPPQSKEGESASVETGAIAGRLSSAACALATDGTPKRASARRGSSFRSRKRIKESAQKLLAAYCNRLNHATAFGLP